MKSARVLPVCSAPVLMAAISAYSVLTPIWLRSKGHRKFVGAGADFDACVLWEGLQAFDAFGFFCWLFSIVNFSGGGGGQNDGGGGVGGYGDM